MPETGRLVVYGEGSFDLAKVVSFLTDLQNAYNSLVAFDIVMDGLRRAERYWPFPGPYPVPLTLGLNAYFVQRRGRGGQIAGEWPPSPERIASLVPARETITLEAVQIASPGHWEFGGLAAVLQVIRGLLKDRDERRKDKGWRESAEKERMLLENIRLRDGIIADRIRFAVEMGLTERDLAPLINELLNRPLIKLGHYQDIGLIGSARMSDEEEDRPA